jgi:hypothetical protein
MLADKELNLDVGADDTLEWLELDNIPEEVNHPFNEHSLLTNLDPIDEVLGVLTNTDYLHFACKTILGIELVPYQLVILDTLWRRRLPMLIGSRGLGKSFLLAVYALMRMVFHPGCKIVIVGAGFRQARQVFDYMTDVWEKAPILRDIAGTGKSIGPRREVDRCQFTIGDSHCYAIPIGDGTKIRGLRANYILADEFASIPEEIFNLVVQGFGIVASSPVDKIKEAAMINRLKKLGQWSKEMNDNKLLNKTGNQIVYSGTAYYAFNHFCRYFKKWHAIISSKGDMKKIKEIFSETDLSTDGFDWRDYAVLRIPYTHVPEGLHDPVILAQAKATLHTNQFLMEYGAAFVTDSNGFYKRSVIEAATTNKPICTSSGKYIQFSARREGSKDHVCVMGVDPAADRDNAAITIVEMHTDHRRIIHCWTTNRKKYNEYKKYMRESGIVIEDDYYRYIAKKIRSLMRVFNIERIAMDKNGGGTAIAEALGNKYSCELNELPVYELIDVEEPKYTDGLEGIHILELLAPTSELNAEANHGMLKDLQDKILLFPLFDTVEMVQALEFDKINDVKFDTYEDLVQEIEELKNEMTTIVVTPSSTLGRETFDTPEVKMDGQKKGRLRKDRYSALLYANYYARSKGKDEVFKMEYKVVGGTKDTINHITVTKGSMYHGPGLLRVANKGWINSPNNYGCVRRK